MLRFWNSHRFGVTMSLLATLLSSWVAVMSFLGNEGAAVGVCWSLVSVLNAYNLVSAVRRYYGRQ